MQVCTNLGSNTATTTTESFAEYSYSYSGSEILTYIEIKSSGSIWVEKVVVTYSTTVKASPASITFPDNTIEVGTDEATSIITLSNGYAQYGNYLNGWFDELSDKDHCDFYVNDAYAYSYTTSGNATQTLTFSYLADAAGTFTGNFIIQGYNSNYKAVNCTIPLSVTITAPPCDKSVTISKGAETNCSFTLSKSGAQASCSGVSTTVTVTPNTGYGTLMLHSRVRVLLPQ